MESRGNTHYAKGAGNDGFGSTLHWGPYWAQDGWAKTHADFALNQGTLADQFHIYGVYWDQFGLYTYLDSPTNKILTVNFTQTDFWHRGGWQSSTFNNPWAGRGNSAPFDREFYLILNVAVGGTNGYFPEGVGSKPWSDGDPHAVNTFYDKISSWSPSWQGDDAALQIDSVKMWQLV